MSIRQVEALLGYGEPQILEVFKITLPSRLYWVLFQIEEPRQPVETAKRIHSKEENRWTTCGSIILYTIYEYMRWVL